jgi:2-haloacid dehalogenase
MKYQLLTFDVYTALFDIEGSLTPLVNEVLKIDGLNFVRAWRRKQLEYALINNSLQQGRLSFEVITHRALDDTRARSQMELPDSSQKQLLEKWLDLEPWPEATQVLENIRSRGYTMGLLYARFKSTAGNLITS